MEGEVEQQQQQKARQQQQQVIRWERFLPRRSLRVLLVENDDSTRHIVAALLRKCSYIVAAVADGVKAWEVLKEKQYKFDIVLSEVDMPSLSGIDFLAKVTACDLSRNIPVIMMSSQDSVNVVFKCMMKGAVDFLVKPVRKNELQNLWQHVWRKHCSSSYISPGERTDDNEAKSQDFSTNNAAINHGNSDAESASKSKDNGGDVGDTQSSGSKLENETRGGEKHPKPYATNIKDPCKVPDKDLGRLSEKVMPEYSSEQHEQNRVEKHNRVEAATEAHVFVQEHKSSQNHPGFDGSNKSSPKKTYLGLNEEIDGNFSSSRSFFTVPNAHPRQIIDFIGVAIGAEDTATSEKGACCNSKDIEGGSLPSKDAAKKMAINGFSGQCFQERNILKHSAASAFSRYGKSICNPDRKSGASTAVSCMSPKESIRRDASFPIWKPAPSVGGETCTPRSKHSICGHTNDYGYAEIHPPGEATSTSHSASLRKEHGINFSSNEVNPESTTFHPSQVELMPFPFPIGRISVQSLYAGYGTVLQPVLYSEPSSSGPTAVHAMQETVPSCNPNNQEIHPVFDPSSQQNHVQYHLEHERVDPAVEGVRRESEAFMCTMEEQIDRQRNHCNEDLCSDEGYRNSDITDFHGGMVISMHQGNENVYPSMKANGLDHGRSHREAALMKFRLKRKDRCFEKKVRYHSRKMLAEQRPRIKGQFVRQSNVKPTAPILGEDD